MAVRTVGVVVESRDPKGVKAFARLLAHFTGYRR